MLKPRLGKYAVAAAVIIGVMLGVGLFTFNYAEGLSYFSTDPKACVNCHIMRDEYDSWRKSSHHAAARCVDCHLPHEIIPKYLAKAENGYRHSKGFTLQDFHEPIQIQSKSSQILQENCLKCHSALVHELVAGSTTAADSNQLRALSCERRPWLAAITEMEPNMTTTDQPPKPSRKKQMTAFIVLVVLAAGLSALITALLINIFERKQEAKNPYLRVVDVTEETTDPEVWARNWPREFDGYKRTQQATRTIFGGSEAMPQEKLDRDPWLRRMFAGYAFSIDYRDRRGHAYMLFDQEQTERVTKKAQPGACLHCHASIIPAYRSVGNGDVMKGFEEVCAMPYQKAHDLADKDGKKLVDHPVSCVDCHDPKNMELRVTRPGFINGIKALKAKQGVNDYDVNRDASRQEMRSFACAQCHVEYYFKGDRKTLTYPWANGTKVEEIEQYYDDVGFTDWKHAETGAPILKAQHPEFEMWSQGIHSRSGVACADCHMPYTREGALKISDHWVRSPLLNISRACQQCHHYPEAEIQARADAIQNRTHDLLQRAAHSLTDMLDTIVAAKKAGATDEQLKPALQLHRKAQWRLDFVAAENSMGFHAPQESARILAESIDYSRQAQLSAQAARAPRAAPPP